MPGGRQLRPLPHRAAARPPAPAFSQPPPRRHAGNRYSHRLHISAASFPASFCGSLNPLNPLFQPPNLHTCAAFLLLDAQLTSPRAALALTFLPHPPPALALPLALARYATQRNPLALNALRYAQHNSTGPHRLFATHSGEENDFSHTTTTTRDVPEKAYLPFVLPFLSLWIHSSSLAWSNDGRKAEGQPGVRASSLRRHREHCRAFAAIHCGQPAGQDAPFQPRGQRSAQESTGSA